MKYRVTIESKAVLESPVEKAVNLHGKSDLEIGKVLGAIEKGVKDLLIRELEEGAVIEVKCTLEKID
jgi:hypothetical protein